MKTLPARSLLALSLIAFVAVGCRTSNGSSSASVAPSPDVVAPHGSLVIVGGGPRSPEIRDRFVQLAGGAGKANVIVFAMASEECRQGGDDEVATLRAMGVEVESRCLTRAEADADSNVARVSRATGIWFGGGDQSRLTGILAGTRVERAMHDRFAAGAVVGGTSAGAAVMSAVMLTGDERHRGGDRLPSDSSDAYLTIARDNVITARGFGFISNAVVDQHFFRRKRHNRLISVVLEHPELIGVGIDESTALVVDSVGRWSVIGASAAIIYDARHATITPPTAKTLGATSVTVSGLPSGSRYDPTTARADLP
ncbi:MAG: cyanophycinase [Gemmatimonadaceae bacterium]